VGGSRSLKLIEEILRSLRELPLFVIGSYRETRSTTHTAAVTLARSRRRASAWSASSSRPRPRRLTKMVMDTLSVSEEKASALSALLNDKTGGNLLPEELPRALYTDGLSRATPRLRWDAERIAQRGVTDNVVDLLAARANELPRRRASAPRGACVAACSISRPSRSSWKSAGGDRRRAVGSGEGGAPLRSSRCLRAWRCAERRRRPVPVRARRVQQAVVSLLDGGALAHLKHTIGARLLAALDAGALEKRMSRWPATSTRAASP